MANLAIDGFFEAAAIPDLLPGALHDFARSIGARGALISTPRLAPDVMPYSSGLRESAQAFFEGGWQHQDLRTIRGQQWVSRNPSGFFRDQDLFSPEDIDRLPYFRDFAVKHDVPWCAACPLIGDANDFVAISLNRRASEGAFTRNEIVALNRALPRLRKAATLLHHAMVANSKGMLFTFDMLSTAALLVDWGGSIGEVNASASKLVGKLFEIRSKRFSISNPQAQRSVEGAIDAATVGRSSADDSAGPVQLKDPRSGETYVLQAIPIRGQAGDVFRHCAAIVLVNSLGPEGVARGAKLLGQLYGLTPRESEVAALLAEGMSANAIGDALRIRADTVRFYIKVILEKSESRRQVEFVRRVAKLLDTTPRPLE